MGNAIGEIGNDKGECDNGKPKGKSQIGKRERKTRNAKRKRESKSANIENAKSRRKFPFLSAKVRRFSRGGTRTYKSPQKV